MGSPGAHFGSKLGSTKGLTEFQFNNYDSVQHREIRRPKQRQRDREMINKGTQGQDYREKKHKTNLELNENFLRRLQIGKISRKRNND